MGEHMKPVGTTHSNADLLLMLEIFFLSSPSDTALGIPGKLRGQNCAQYKQFSKKTKRGVIVIQAKRDNLTQ